MGARKILWGVSLWMLASSMAAFAEDEGGAAPNKRVDVDKLRKQYWSQGAEYDVVQNRLYPKKGRIETYLFGGSIATDPFLSVQSLGLAIGYHFSEYISVQALGWRAFSTGSTALEVLENDVGSTAHVNHPKLFLGGEGCFSVVYGKLSLLGEAILYYDLHLLAGGGLTDTDNGKYPTFHGGIGQQIYITRTFALRTDFRLMYFNEEIKNSAGELKPRENWSSVVTLGVSVFLP